MPAPIIAVAHPGQYLQEVEIGPRLVSGAGKGYGAMPAVCEKGPIGLPIIIRSPDEYQTIFGGPVKGYFSYDAMLGYFSEARAPLIVIRTAHYGGTIGVYDAIASVATLANGAGNIGTVQAKNEGVWGDGGTVEFANTVDLKASSDTVGSFPAVGEKSYNIENADSFEIGDHVKLTGGGLSSDEFSVITAVDDSKDIITVEYALVGTATSAVTIETVTFTVTIKHQGSEEVFTEVSMSETSPEYFFSKFSDENYGITSKSTIISSTLSGSIVLTADSRPIVGTLTLAGGDDGLGSLDTSDFVGTTNVGLTAIKDVNNAKLLFCVDHWGLASAGASDNATVYKAIVALAKSKRFAFALGDLTEDATRTGTTAGSAKYEVQTDISNKDMFGALYYPWIQVNLSRTNRPGFIPSVGDIAGVITKIDEVRGVYKAPAGEEVRLNRVIAIKHAITDEDQDQLNPIGLNCVRVFAGVGTIIYGTRTQSNNPKWRYIPVRRYQSYIEESVINSTRWAVFEPNDAELRGNLTEAITSFMTRLVNAGSLASRNPADAFVVRCDSTNNTLDTIDEGRLIIDVGVAHLKPAEFMIYRFTQTRAGNQVEQISQL